MSIHAQLLSNGRYAVMLTASGAGFSRWRDVAVTRWREDPTRDPWGSHLLLRDVESGAVWTAGARGGTAGSLSTTVEVAVDPDRDAEVRRVSITNHGDGARDISLTSYAELVLGSADRDAAHPAFSKLFVHTEVVEEEGILLATRRRQSPSEPEVWAAHLAVVPGPRMEGPGFTPGPGEHAHRLECETSRARFLGRGRTLRDAVAMAGDALSNTVGAVLDPIFSVRERVRIAAGGSACVAFWTVVAASRAEVLALARAVRGADLDHTIAAAAESAAAARVRLSIDAAEAERTGALLGPLLYADAAWRAPPEVLERGRGGAPVLWARGISGDRPIVLLRIADHEGLGRVDELFRAQVWWRASRLGVDVVVLDAATDDALHAALDLVFRTHEARLEADRDGAAAAVFLLRDDQIDDPLRDGVSTAARLVLDAAIPAEPRATRAAAPPAFQPVSPTPTVARRRREPAPLELANGTGGFDARDREYVITLAAGRCTPAPWINVIANPSFGFVVSAEGGGYTWAVNSQQNPLTPWPNDPVSDTPHEILYLRDEETGALWSATALPIGVPGATYTTAHGKGYSRFAHEAYGIEVELVQFAALTDPVKLSRLCLRNRSGRRRRLSITAYVEWALGPNGKVSQPFVVTSIDPASGALFARNAWRAEFAERVAFIDLGGAQSSCTGDRGDLLGRDGGVDRPAALLGPQPLSGRVGSGLDPCGALQTHVELAPDTEVEIVFVLGEAASEADARQLIDSYRAADLDAVVRDVGSQWDDVLGTVQVTTPERSMDLLLDDWLLYQTLSCRLWARTAYYQASGAYGFRDQLQDVMALCVTRPALVRQHLLHAASRQFAPGDVQHWWLPPAGQGVRTRISDDRLWLPYVAAHYVGVTADVAVLDVIVPFLDGPALAPDQHEAFFLPTAAREAASVYEHCARAIDISLSLGAHGLPLFGTGDWNDGMNRVGEQGRGESVWLGWFLLAAIDAFAPHAELRRDQARLAHWQQVAATVRTALERDGWDGEWYRRGYYDDGTPLGSSDSSECKIDAIAQSWSAMSGTADADHAARAMTSVDRLLIDHANKVALLFTPPFDRTIQEPGYIKAYPPGIRENGGQYTHGAIWSIFAFAALGDGDRAGELFAILDPIRHSSTPEAAACYQVEPYVACADVYAVAPHVGRGGWTWYSGSAGWLYRAGLEAILGFRVQGRVLALDPCVPKAWPGFQIVYRHRGADARITRYEIAVENPHHVSRGVARAELDGAALANDVARIPLVDDGGIHRVRVVLGARSA